MDLGGTISATLRTVGGKGLDLIRRLRAFVVGKELILDSPFAGGRSGASNPSLIATNSLNFTMQYLLISPP
jgi:hypothetical protein